MSPLSLFFFTYYFTFYIFRLLVQFSMLKKNPYLFSIKYESIFKVKNYKLQRLIPVLPLDIHASYNFYIFSCIFYCTLRYIAINIRFV